jgi:hypothetical protein
MDPCAALFYEQDVNRCLIFVVFKGVVQISGGRPKRRVDGIASQSDDRHTKGNVKSYCGFHGVSSVYEGRTPIMLRRINNICRAK